MNDLWHMFIPTTPIRFRLKATDGGKADSVCRFIGAQILTQLKSAFLEIHGCGSKWKTDVGPQMEKSIV